MTDRPRLERIKNYIIHYSPVIPKIIIGFDSNFDLGAKEIRRHGRAFNVARTMKYRDFWKDETWEPTTYDNLDRYLDPEHSCIDLGAWIGPTVLYGACLSKCVYAIEPDPVAMKYLQKNIRLNPSMQDKVKLFDCCLGDHDGTVRFSSKSAGGDAESGVSIENAKTSWFVRSKRFDTFVRENEITDCNFIKIDIEGSEFIVVPTMKEFVEMYKPVLCLSIHTPRSIDPAGDVKKLLGILALYKNIYLDDGTRIQVDSLLNGRFLSRYNTIVATDR